MKGKQMTEAQAIRYITEAFRARVVPLSEIVKLRSLKSLNAELYAQMDNEGAFDEPWWLDYQE
jgi:hypothetical protein